jgi:hypothetical protein
MEVKSRVMTCRNGSDLGLSAEVFLDNQGHAEDGGEKQADDLPQRQFLSRWRNPHLKIF